MYSISMYAMGNGGNLLLNNSVWQHIHICYKKKTMRRDVTSRSGAHISDLVKTLLNFVPISDAVSNKGLRPHSLCCGCRYYEKRHIKSSYLFHVRPFSRGTPYLM
jgi:hypothetical protein